MIVTAHRQTPPAWSATVHEKRVCLLLLFLPPSPAAENIRLLPQFMILATRLWIISDQKEMLQKAQNIPATQSSRRREASVPFDTQDNGAQ